MTVEEFIRHPLFVAIALLIIGALITSIVSRIRYFVMRKLMNLREHLTNAETDLIAILLDVRARVDERDDAAMYLHKYDTVETERALLVVASDPNAPEMVVASCGESLGEIWKRRGHFSQADLNRLLPTARVEALAILRP